jgi:hypothetical protein
VKQEKFNQSKIFGARAGANRRRRMAPLVAPAQTHDLIFLPFVSHFRSLSWYSTGSAQEQRHHFERYKQIETVELCSILFQTAACRFDQEECHGSVRKIIAFAPTFLGRNDRNGGGWFRKTSLR